jgi:hypothetical protein
MKRYLILLTLISIDLQSCSTVNKLQESKENMIYKVKRAAGTVDFNDNWNDIQWAKADVLELKNYMGSKPQHFPKTCAKLLYDEKNIYVFFKVDDRYVRAEAQKLHDPVCRDSCVEFFFTPGENLSDGYFNVEINCAGIMLMSHQTARGENTVKISEQDGKKIKICDSMPREVKPEIQEPITWTLQYSLPLDILRNYANVTTPCSGVKWRANFYKCADNSSHPHWLTWSVVDKPKPDFHQPRYFGTLLFE